MKTTYRLALGLLCLLLAVLARKKKKAPNDGSDNGGMFTCTDVYIYGYFNETKANGGTFAAWDYAQILDTDDNNDQVKMLDKNFLNGICTPIPYMSDFMAEIDVGDPSLGEEVFKSWINYNKKDKSYPYKGEMVGGPKPANRSEDTTWEGGTVREDSQVISNSWETDPETGWTTHVETTKEVITLTTEELMTTIYKPPGTLRRTKPYQKKFRRGSRGPGRKLLGDEDLLGPAVVETTELPYLVDSCGESGDPDHPYKSELDAVYPMCASRDFEWSCEMTDVPAVTALMKSLKEFQADDCWTINMYDAKCPGAPVGPQTCVNTGDEIGDGDFVVGVHITVEGDNCKACSLNPDLCPGFYDVHSCTYEWITTTDQSLATEGYYDEDGESREGNTADTEANHAGEFKIVYTINAGGVTAPASLVVSTAIAILAWFVSMP